MSSSSNKENMTSAPDASQGLSMEERLKKWQEMKHKEKESQGNKVEPQSAKKRAEDLVMRRRHLAEKEIKALLETHEQFEDVGEMRKLFEQLRKEHREVAFEAVYWQTRAEFEIAFGQLHEADEILAAAIERGVEPSDQLWSLRSQISVLRKLPTINDGHAIGPVKTKKGDEELKFQSLVQSVMDSFPTLHENSNDEKNVPVSRTPEIQKKNMTMTPLSAGGGRSFLLSPERVPLSSVPRQSSRKEDGSRSSIFSPRKLNITGSASRVRVNKHSDARNIQDSSSENVFDSTDIELVAVRASRSQREEYGTDFLLSPVRRTARKRTDREARKLPSENIHSLLEQSNYTYVPQVSHALECSSSQSTCPGRTLSFDDEDCLKININMDTLTPDTAIQADMENKPDIPVFTSAVEEHSLVSDECVTGDCTVQLDTSCNSPGIHLRDVDLDNIIQTKNEVLVASKTPRKLRSATDSSLILTPVRRSARIASHTPRSKTSTLLVNVPAEESDSGHEEWVEIQRDHLDRL